MSDRPLKVLHVGNVANNAYLNARLLNQTGVESDLLCYGNYHVMASPEWEEAEIDASHVDAERPDWDSVVQSPFARPRWFVQGPFGPSARYLEARRGGPQWLANLRWRIVEMRRHMVSGRNWKPLRSLRDVVRGRAASPGAPGAGPTTDRPAPDDGARYGATRNWTPSQLVALFACYDLVHAYGEEPILPLVAGNRPYVAWEHGTLRHLPFQPTLEGRLTAQAYQRADQVVITNADNKHAADRLGITRYRFIPHPTNEIRPEAAAVAGLRARLLAQLDADFLVFHPSRQHWSADRHPHFEKGNDLLIDALGRFFREHPRAAAIFVDWGQSVDASRALLAKVGAAGRVHWIAPQGGRSMTRYMMASDLVADQFFLGSFGGIMPRAMFLERPVLIHVDEAAHRWCFPEMPPVINARTPDAIFAGLARAYTDPAWRQDLGRRGKSWYDAHHSSDLVRRSLVDLYADALSGSGGGGR